MNHWIFQGNPDVFDIDTYLASSTDIAWSVRQHHLASDMQPGDTVFLWRASGKRKAKAGIVAQGVITGSPELMDDDAASKGLYTASEPAHAELRVKIHIQKTCLRDKEIVQRAWLENDPVVSNMLILRMRQQTNYRIESTEAERLSQLVQNTGRNWDREESLAGLWAYAHTLDKSVSKLSGSPVSEVAISIGRAVDGVYNKVMDFRAIDPTDSRKGLSAGGQTDKDVWDEFFDTDSNSIDVDKLDREYELLWRKKVAHVDTRVPYKDFGDAPNDDPDELQQFASRVRRGQPAFRDNLLSAYGERCALTGHGPKEVLEAVHIVPHAESGINELDNGLLMRADLHALFDAKLLNINPDDLTVVVDAALSDTPYWDLNGKEIRPRVDGTQMSAKYLKVRWES